IDIMFRPPFQIGAQWNSRKSKHCYQWDSVNEQLGAVEQIEHLLNLIRQLAKLRLHLKNAILRACRKKPVCTLWVGSKRSESTLPDPAHLGTSKNRRIISIRSISSPRVGFWKHPPCSSKLPAWPLTNLTFRGSPAQSGCSATLLI